MVWVSTDGSFFRPDSPLLCPILGADVPVLIYTDGQEIQPNQLQALSRFLAISLDAQDSLNGPLFADYREVHNAVGEGPDISGPEQISAFVRWTTVLVPLQGPSGSRFLFVKGDPAWEEEHGVELFFRDERLVRVGRESGAFLSSCFWAWT